MTIALDLQKMINALPPIAWRGFVWPHAGVIEVPGGAFEISSTVRIDSPFVIIRGQGAVATQLHFTGKGPAIEWTSRGLNSGIGQTLAGGLRDLSIVGYKAQPGSFGLVTRDLIGFSSTRVSICGFNQPGSAGWWDDTVLWFNERYDVEMEMGDNQDCWLVTNNHAPGSFNGYTYGYGCLKLWLNCIKGGNAIRSVGKSKDYPAQVWNESAHIVVNGADGKCFNLNNYSHWHLQGMVHCEQNPKGLVTDWTSYLVVNGYSTGLYANQFHKVGSNLLQRAKQAYHKVHKIGAELY